MAHPYNLDATEGRFWEVSVTTSLTFRSGDAGMGGRMLEQIIGSSPALGAVPSGGPMREIAKISLDLFVLGACSMGAERGWRSIRLRQCQVKATFIESASSIVLAVQNKKSGTVTTHKIAAIKVTTAIAVEADASPSLTEPLCSKEIQVHYAKQAQSGMVDNT